MLKKEKNKPDSSFILNIPKKIMNIKNMKKKEEIIYNFAIPIRESILYLIEITWLGSYIGNRITN
jgi:hypothetical protein